MDRVLELTDSILISLETDPDTLKDLAGNDDIWPFLLTQLSSSAWGYIIDSSICIVTRIFVGLARVERNGAVQSELIFTEFNQTSSQDVTAAFRDGYKIIATWVGNEKTGLPANDSFMGAAQLWTLLGGEEAGKVDESSSRKRLGSSSNHSPSPSWEDKTGDQRPTEPDGPILPQNEIDRLIAGLRDKGAMEEKPIEQTPSSTRPEMVIEASTQVLGEKPIEQTPSSPGPEMVIEASTQVMGEKPIEQTPSSTRPEMVIEPSTQVQEIEVPPQQISSTLREETIQIPSTPAGLSPGVSLEEWTDAPNPPIQGSSAQLDDSVLSLEHFSAGQPYSILIFEHRSDFDRELENLREISSGTILALWENNPIYLRLGTRLFQNLENYRARYRAAAATLESSITHLRQQEQMLPNLQNYRNQQGTLAVESEKINHEMHIMRMKQVLDTHEGRFLARKVFGIEATRQSLLGDLARLTYRVLRRPNPSFLARSRFIGRRQKYLGIQKQLESSFNKLANLEREVQRRLEYQADWQAMVARKFKIQREQDEIGRFIRATASIPGGPSADSDSLNRWLKSEWDAIKRRERLLRAWQECLTDEKSWSLRSFDEPVLVLADSSLLTLPGVARGALVVAVASNHTSIMAEIPEGCAGWVMIDQGLRIVGSGKGPGFNEDPFLATVSDLAKETELSLQEAFQSLGFEDQIK